MSQNKAWNSGNIAQPLVISPFWLKQRFVTQPKLAEGNFPGDWAGQAHSAEAREPEQAFQLFNAVNGTAILVSTVDRSRLGSALTQNFDPLLEFSIFFGNFKSFFNLLLLRAYRSRIVQIVFFLSTRANRSIALLPSLLNNAHHR